MAKLNWVKMDASGYSNCVTYRCKIPGGHLVAVGDSTGAPAGVTFVPDTDKLINTNSGMNIWG